MDCGSFDLTTRVPSIPSVYRCNDCNGTNIIVYPEYLPLEQSNRYIKALKNRKWVNNEKKE